MTILNATEARSKLYTLIDETAETHQPIVITEILHLLSVPGMRKSIKEGLWQDISELSEELDW